MNDIDLTMFVTFLSSDQVVKFSEREERSVNEAWRLVIDELVSSRIYNLD